MSIQTCVHGTAAEVNLMRVYFPGTDTLKEGYPVCWNFDAADVDAENNTFTANDVGVEFWNDARRIQVEKPSEGNKLHFAGVVSEKFENFTGPGWIEIHRPGSICNVWCASSVDHGQTGITTNTGQTVTFGPTAWTFKTGGYPGTGSAIILQDENRSSTAGLIMAELMTGEPSGGNHFVSCCSSTSGLSAAVAAVMVMAGVYTVSERSVASSAIASLDIAASDGSYIGQRFKIVFPTGVALSQSSISIHVKAVYKGVFSATTSGNISAHAQLDAAGDFLEMRWNGSAWVVLASTEIGGLVS